MALVIALVGLSLPACLWAQSDSFEDGNDTGWTHYQPLGPGTGQFTVTAGRYHITASVSPNPAFGGGRAGSLRLDATYNDFYVAVDRVEWSAAADQAVGLVARVRQPDFVTTDGYSFTVQIGDQLVSISRLTDESPADLAGTSVAFTLNPAQDYRLVFLGQGTRLEGRIYALTHPPMAPTWCIA